MSIEGEGGVGGNIAHRVSYGLGIPSENPDVMVATKITLECIGFLPRGRIREQAVQLNAIPYRYADEL